MFQKRKRKEKAISFTFRHKFKETNEVLGKIVSKQISKNLTFPFLTVLPFYTFVCLCFYFFVNVIFLALLPFNCLSGMSFSVQCKWNLSFLVYFSICSVCPTALSILWRITLLLNIDHGSLFRLFHSRHWPQKICKYYFILFCFFWFNISLCLSDAVTSLKYKK